MKKTVKNNSGLDISFKIGKYPDGGTALMLCATLRSGKIISLQEEVTVDVGETDPQLVYISSVGDDSYILRQLFNIGVISIERSQPPIYNKDDCSKVYIMAMLLEGFEQYVSNKSNKEVCEILGLTYYEPTEVTTADLLGVAQGVAQPTEEEEVQTEEEQEETPQEESEQEEDNSSSHTSNSSGFFTTDNNTTDDDLYC